MLFHIQGLHHIQLAGPKGCEEEARRFYHQILGLLEIPKPPELAKRGGVWFVCGNQEIHIGIEEPFIPSKKAHPAFTVTGLQEIRLHLQHNGISYQDDHQILNAERIYVFDPFGNRLEFMEWK